MSDHADAPLSPTEMSVVDRLDDLVDAVLDDDPEAAEHAIGAILALVRSHPEPDDIAEVLALLIADEYMQAQSDQADPAVLYDYLTVCCVLGDELGAPAFSAVFLERATHDSAPDVAARLEDARRAASLARGWSSDLNARAALLVASLLAMDPAASPQVLNQAKEALSQVRVGDEEVEAVVATAVAASLSAALLRLGDVDGAVAASHAGLERLDRAGLVLDEASGRAAAAAHTAAALRYGTAVPTDAEARAILSVVRRCREWVPPEVLPPSRIDLLHLVTILGTGDVAEVEEAFTTVERERAELTERDLAMLTLASAEWALLRGDLPAATARTGEARPLVESVGDEYLSSLHGTLVGALGALGSVGTAGSAAGDPPLVVLPGMSEDAIVEQLGIARSRGMSGRPQPTLPDELLALADVISPEQPQLRLEVLRVAAATVPARWGATPPASMSEALTQSEAILNRLEAELDRTLATRPSAAPVQTRIFLETARAANAMARGQVGAAMARLEALAASLEVRDRPLYAAVVASTALGVADMVGDRRVALHWATVVIDEMARVRAQMSSAEDRARVEGFYRDAIGQAVDAAEQDPQVLAELVEAVRAQAMPVAPAAPSPSQTPLSVLMSLAGDPLGPTAAATRPLVSGVLGSAADLAADQWQVTYLGLPPRILMPGGRIALDEFRRSVRDEHAQPPARLTVHR